MCLKCFDARCCVTTDDIDQPSMFVTRRVYLTLIDSLLVIYDCVINHRVEEPDEDEYDDEEEFNKRRSKYEQWKATLEGMNQVMEIMRRAKVEDDDESEDEDHPEEPTEDEYEDEEESPGHERSKECAEFIAVFKAMEKIKEILDRCVVEGDDDDDDEDGYDDEDDYDDEDEEAELEV